MMSEFSIQAQGMARAYFEAQPTFTAEPLTRGIVFAFLWESSHALTVTRIDQLLQALLPPSDRPEHEEQIKAALKQITRHGFLRSRTDSGVRVWEINFPEAR